MALGRLCLLLRCEKSMLTTNKQKLVLTFFVSRLGGFRTIGSVFIVDFDDIFIDDGRGRDATGRIVMVMIMVIDLGNICWGYFVLGPQWQRTIGTTGCVRSWVGMRLS